MLILKIDTVWLVCKAHCIWYEMKINDLSFFIWFVYCTHSHDSYVYEDNTRTHHMFDDRNRHNISRYMILWRGFFDMLQHVFMKNGLCHANMLRVCACLLCPGSLFQAASVGFHWVNSPQNLLSSSLQHWDMEVKFFSNVLSRIHPPPKTLGKHCAQHLQV